MTNVIMYSTAYCPYCIRARELLTRKNIAFHEIRVDDEPSKREEMIARSNRRTVPQIFINDKSIGGYDDLYALEDQGELDNLLK
jgi:glutaredoxin 3